MGETRLTRHQRMEETRAHALREAVILFLQQGYHDTTLDQIAKRIGRTKAALLRAFPDKEAILFALVTHMFSNQFGKVRNLLPPDADPLLVYGVETALQLCICELSPELRDIYLAAYTLESTCDYIYHNTSRELSQIFGEFLPEATPSDFYEMELASGGVMRGYMTKQCDVYFDLERKISLFLQSALKIYEVPKARREAVIAQVLMLDMLSMAQHTVQETVALAHKGFSPEILNATEIHRKKGIE